jgi:16S rRNA (cytidine1402-2'-O)-methyltransferase
MSAATLYLLPAPLDPEATWVIPAYLPDYILRCQVFFVENERTTRRYFKQLFRELRPGTDIVIDDYTWHTVKEPQASAQFKEAVRQGQTIGLVSEAGCPGIADPGQQLVALAHQLQVKVVPLTGPSSLLLALMASGMSGQQFRFHGYLPVEAGARDKAIRELENEAWQKQCTQVFIETPYRNNALLEALLRQCRPATRLCIAVSVTGPQERIHTRSIADWKKDKPELHKQPVLFCLAAADAPST